MEPFREHTGLVVPLDRSNVDTDQIIPKQFLKGLGRNGYGEFLFYDWRHESGGAINPNFTLNFGRYRGASILVAGPNFGCGSSREHAPWALSDFGFRVVVAPSFADIFAINCAKNGLLTVTLSGAEVAELMRRASDTRGYSLTVNLEDCTVADGSGFAATFELDPFSRRRLLEGLDEIGFTLRYGPEITAYEARRPRWRGAFGEG